MDEIKGIIIEGEHPWESEHKFNDFEEAIKYCEDSFRYKGKGWEKVKKSNDFLLLFEFLVVRKSIDAVPVKANK